MAAAPGATEYAEACACGNVFMDDSMFCRKCGAKRPPKAEPEQIRRVASAPSVGLQIPLGAEDAASAAVDAILSRGGKELYNQYIKRKSFAFATDTATTKAVCAVEMSNPTHTSADADGEWSLEDEIPPPGSDNFIRMVLNRPQRQVSESSASSSAGQLRPQSAPARQRPRLQRRQTAVSLQKADSDARTLGRAITTPSVGSRPYSAQPFTGGRGRDQRAFPITDPVVPDEEEDRLRAAMVKEETTRALAEEETRQRIMQTEAEERAELQRRLTEEADTRPRSVDPGGRVTFTMDHNPEAFPALQKHMDADVETMESDQLAEAPPMQSLPVRKSRSAPLHQALHRTRSSLHTKKLGDSRKSCRLRKHTEDEFPDAFYVPDHMQPPVLDTMKVQPGVVLQCMGRRKLGPRDDGDHRMSRKEYIRLAERRDQHSSRPQSAAPSLGGGSTRETAATTSSKRLERPSSAPGSRAHSRHGDSVARSDQNDRRELAQDSKTRATGGETESRTTSKSGSRTPSRSSKPVVFVGHPEKSKKAPPAPAWHVRNKGHALNRGTRPPRFHTCPLGTLSSSGPIQPPLGATMGHGLLRGSSREDAYYFPPQGGGQANQGSQLSAPASPVRISSEPALGHGGAALK